MKINRVICLFLVICLTFGCLSWPAITRAENVYYVGQTVNSVRDTGYTEAIPLKDGDPHFGWELGKFYFEGYESMDIEDSGTPVFYIKKDDPSFKLKFVSNYDIHKLNGTNQLQINEDTNGYDVHFEVTKTDFGYGALFIRRTDYKTGKKDKTERRLNFLYSRPANAPFVVRNSFDEGDYEASLDYEIKQYYGWFGSNWWNYKIPFSFKIRCLEEEEPVIEGEVSEFFEKTDSEQAVGNMGKPESASPEDSERYKLVMTSELLSDAVHIESEEDQSNLLTEYYFDPNNNATIILLALKNNGDYISPLVGENLTLLDFAKSIGENNIEAIAGDDDSVLFSYKQDNEVISAKARTYRTDHYISIAIVASKGSEKNVALYDKWLDSLQVYEPDLELSADASPHGVWEIGLGNAITIQRIFGDEMMLATKEPWRHGFAAERANLLAGQIRSVFTGEKIEYIGGDNILNGADFSIKDSSGHISYIQSKYYNSAKNSINACFNENGMYKYKWDGEPMLVEVPKDQYDEAVLLMAEKIRAGKVEGVTDPNKAKDLVRKGTVTYKQAVNIAKAGTVDSLKYDAAHGCVAAGSAFGISALVEFAMSCWQNEPVDVAMKRSVFTGLQVGGSAFVVSVVSSQLSKTLINQSMIPASRAIVNFLGPKAAQTFVNAFRPASNAIYGAAAKQAAAKLLRGNVITATVSFVVFSVPDIIDTFRGRISPKQLLKNSATLVGGIAGGGLGAWGGAAVGTAIAPGVGTVLGGIVGGVLGSVGVSAGVDAIADMISEDDAEEMLNIISEEYSRIAQDYLLSQEEGERVNVLLENKINADVLKNMYASNNHKAFANNLIEPIIAEEANNRERIVLPSEEEYADVVITVLEAIHDESD